MALSPSPEAVEHRSDTPSGVPVIWFLDWLDRDAESTDEDRQWWRSLLTG